MNSRTLELQELGVSLWLDKISKPLLDSGTLAHYIDELSITGLTSNPTLFEQALGEGKAYDEAIAAGVAADLEGEELFFELALDDLRRAADLFRPAFDASDGADGYVSLEISPLLADNAAHAIRAADRLFRRADRPNLFIKIPGTAEGVLAIEEVIFDGVPVNVTLLFSREHYVAAAQAYMAGLERRMEAGLDLKVNSVASVFISRWDSAIKDDIAAVLHNRLGIAMAMRIYRAHIELLASPRWRRLSAAGASVQRLLWASTGTKDPAAPDTLYVQALIAPRTICTLPEKTLLAYADHGRADQPLPPDGGLCEAVLQEFAREGVDDEAMAARLQRDGVDAFALSWHAMLTRLQAKTDAILHG